ncbi:MAG TPA: transglycosylase SLT domain-containing protein [Burkholderiales bacterium]
MFRLTSFCARAFVALALVGQCALAAPRRPAAEPPVPTDPDAALMAARDALRAGNRDRLAKAAAVLQGTPMEVYGAYWMLLAGRAGRYSDPDDSDYLSFLGKYDKTYLAERARTDWVKLLGRKREWDQFEAERGKLVFNDDPEIQCYAALHRVIMNSRDEATLREAMRLYLSPRELGDGCTTMAETLINAARITDRQVWDRMRVLADNGLLPALQRTAGYLPDSQSVDAKTLEALYKQPDKFLKRKSDHSTRRERELTLLALSRLAQSDPRAAAAYWTGEDKKPFLESERQWGWAVVGYWGAKRLIPDAVKWFGEAKEIQLPDEYLQWEARAALRARDWKMTRHAIRGMSAETRRDSTWTYWLARGLKEEGKPEDAKQLFESIAGEYSFYGQLAAAELGRVTVIPPVGYKPTKEEVDAMGREPCFVRALNLYRIGLRPEASREWNFCIQRLDDKQLLAVATLGRINGLPDRAINTADKTVALHDFTLRYLSPHLEEVKTQAEAVGLDDAWVYGLMRQESRFITDARSGVGASGLMQLMPATARWVAKKIGMTDFQPAQVNDLGTNLTLGTNYLKMVLDELFDHQALASAAYNAGPGRPRRWRDVKPMEAAVFAETIPLNETRDYVKKVISNAVIYQALFTGKPASIKDRLPPVPARLPEEKPVDMP